MKKITSFKSTWLLIFALIICFGAQAQVYSGSLTLSSQAEVNAFNYSEVTGDLNIGYKLTSDITDFSPLLSLNIVNGNLNIYRNDGIINLEGLNNISIVGGDFIIRNNENLTSLIGIYNMINIGGNLTIFQNDKLTNLAGVENINSIGGISIKDNDHLISLAELENITSVSGNLIISYNDYLTSLMGLENINNVGGELTVLSNNKINSIAGLKNITSVFGNLTISSSHYLTSLSGLENITSVGGDLYIRNNPVLSSFCSLYGLINNGDLTGNYSVSGNAVNPTEEEIINGGNCQPIYVGDLVLWSQEMVNAFNYGEVTGSLSIGNGFDDITDITPLSSLRTVGGDLDIMGNIEIDEIPPFSTDGTTIEPDNIRLLSLAGLENLTSIGGHLWILNTYLTNLSGLNNIKAIGKWLYISDNSRTSAYTTGPTSLVGLENLSYIGGGISAMGSKLTNLLGLDNLTHIGESLFLLENLELSSLAGIESLTSVGGIEISRNPFLTSLSGLENVESLKILHLNNNSLLTNLSGLDNLNILEWDLNITNNDLLSNFCSLHGLLTGGRMSGDYIITGNAVNPTLQEIRDNGPCNSPPLAICQNVTVPANENCQAIISPADIDNGSTDPDGDEISLSISPEGLYNIGVTNVTLTVEDGMGGTASCEATITVFDYTPPVITCPANVTLECPADTDPVSTGFATATDNCGTATVTYVDESVPGCGNTEVLLRTWIATDNSGNSATCEQTITVLDTHPPLINCPNNVTLECPANTYPASTGFATATDNCGTATVTYVDESVPGCGNTEVITRTWIATDECGNSASANQTINVIDEVPPVISGVPDEIVQENDPGECGAIVIFPAINANDYCDGYVALSTEPASGDFFPVGVTTVNVTASDECGNASHASFDVVVTNEEPIIQSISASVDPFIINSFVTVDAIFSDNNIVDAEFDWGDGTITNGIISGDEIEGEHSYDEAGVYVVRITVVDACGLSDTETYQYIVVYDPSEGFVTGGGWIYSPSGAYLLDPLLEGKANFGFVSKYKKGKTIPEGNTEFQFKAGNFNFKSTEYEWLVIAGSKAMFKGSGTVNGFGNYGFMLSGIDADLTPSAETDKFRIKIWDKNNNDLIVYDNNLELEENADPTTEIGGGSIVIHKSKEKAAQIETGISLLSESSELLVYPNPFNERLHFEFVSPVNVHASIDIFDATGRKVKNIFNELIESGVSYFAEFVPVDEVSSFYFYRMEIGGKIFNGKVVYNKR